MIHTLPLGVTVNFVRREKRLSRAGAGFWIDIGIVARSILYALVAQLFEIALWGVVLIICGELFSRANGSIQSALASRR
jgi:hypothetical protein